MTEENKSKKAETEKQEEVARGERGERGELGTATPSKALKRLWHEEHFTRQDKHSWRRNGGAPSLRKFAKLQAAAGNQVAKDWLDNKAGALNTERSEKNRGRISLEKQASKAARRKKSQGKQGKAASTDAAATATAAVATAGKGKKK